jgi:hypothetical protein
MAIIEIEEFKLAAGVSDEVFVAADAAYQEYCYVHHRGLLRRTTARSQDAWAVVTLWESPPHVVAAAAVADWRSHIDESSYRERSFKALEG